MKIAVVGGSGFIGMNLVKLLLDEGHEVRILDKVKSDVFPEICYDVDVRKIETLRQPMQGVEVIYNLAAEHKDNVTPISLYYDVNVEGAKNICQIAKEYKINKLIFTSSVAVYGFVENETNEDGQKKPFNDYGKSKLMAEEVYDDWYNKQKGLSLIVVRPTVVFGVRNRGNVYNLLQQIISGKFIMVGNGKNKKSMAYVENLSAFLLYCLKLGNIKTICSYVDKPDYDMNALVSLVNKMIGKGEKIRLRFPYFIGYLGGLFFDCLSFITRKKFPISSIRVKKFCANTHFTSNNIFSTGFQPPFSIEDGLKRTIEYEFLSK